jgi:SH3-like domain-containing protein
MTGRGLGSLLLAAACLCIVAAALFALLSDKSGTEVQAAAVAASETTASIDSDTALGASGLPLPRFVSLKTDLVNVRRGPSSEHEVVWVFRRRGLPVEIIAEFEHWRRIRDSDGEEGWVYHSLLAGKRTALVEPWKKTSAITMRRTPTGSAAAVAMLPSGVVAEVERCDGTWCEMAVDGYEGWVAQVDLYGVYPGESIED